MKALLPWQQVTRRQRGMMGFRHMDANMYRGVCSACLCSQTSVSALQAFHHWGPSVELNHGTRRGPQVRPYLWRPSLIPSLSAHHEWLLSPNVCMTDDSWEKTKKDWENTGHKRLGLRENTPSICSGPNTHPPITGATAGASVKLQVAPDQNKSPLLFSSSLRPRSSTVLPEKPPGLFSMLWCDWHAYKQFLSRLFADISTDGLLSH